MDATQNYSSNQGFYVHTTREEYTEITTTEQKFLRFTSVPPYEQQQQRNTVADLYVKMQIPKKSNEQNLVSHNTLIDSLPYPAEGVEVVYTVDPVDAEAWLRNNITDCSAQVVGLDIEWKPQFVSKKKGGVQSKTAVLQLGVESSCLVLHLHKMKELPNLLRSILNDEKIIKVGSGILQDFKKLKRDRGLTCKGMVDTQKLAKSVGVKTSWGLGLKALAGHFLRINLEKPKSVTLSNWENYPLTMRQIHYAALDAWIGFKLYQHMKLMSGQNQTQIENKLVIHGVDESPVKTAICHVCNKKCKGQDVLNSHIKIHPQCKCGKYFVTKVSKRHDRNCGKLNTVTQKPDESDKNPVEIIICHVCNKKCKGQDALNSHIKIHPQCKCGKYFVAKVSKSHEQKCVELNPVTSQLVNEQVEENFVESIVCCVCKEECKGKDVLASHMKIHPQCKCGKLFVAKVSKNHKRNCAKLHPDIVNCQVCKKKCQGEDVHASHIKIHPQCKCGKFFVTKVSMSHKRNCTKLHPEIANCQVCKKKCKGQDALASHVKIHPQCKCGKYFVAKVSKSHEQKCVVLDPVTQKLDEVYNNPVDVIICRVCKEECKGQDAHASHVKIHPQCKCGKYFVTKVSKNHKKNCTKLHPEIVRCHVCKKKCKGEHALASHIKVHPQCKCGKLFVAKVSKHHEQKCAELDPVTQKLVHDEANEKSVIKEIFVCIVCKKKCKGKDAHASHIKIHPQCKCGKFFVSKVSRSHKKNCAALNPVTSQAQLVSDNIYHCQACGKKCKTEEKLMKHIIDVGHVQCPFFTRLLNGPQCTRHIKRCKRIVSEEWKQIQL